MKIKRLIVGAWALCGFLGLGSVVAKFRLSGNV